MALVFCLIFVGGLVTSWQAGMAVPDWPLSFGSLNPEGWWGNFPVRLEHGHRLLAACVGLAVGVLCSAVWGNSRALGVAAVVSLGAGFAGKYLGASAALLAHLGIWPAALAFVACLFGMSRRNPAVGGAERGLALAAFLLVICQATLGGLRVTRETAGAVDVALVFRIVHGCVAQAFLVVLVALSARISILAGNRELPGLGKNLPTGLVWTALLVVYGQLILGATMRHMGAGLAIPTFPAANASGGWMPQTHNLYTDLNFGHTRFGALVVCTVVLVTAGRVLFSSRRGGSVWIGAARCGLLVVIQAALGILVVLHQKPKTLATVHVVLGATLLASVAALLVRCHDAKSAEVPR